MDGTKEASRRIAASAKVAGAMHRVFICVGSSDEKEKLLADLCDRGIDVVREPLSVMSIFPSAFLSHQGTHFNNKLFVFEGLEDLHVRLGEDFFKRVLFEQRWLNRTATWSLFWFEDFTLAYEFQRSARAIWSSADEKSVLFSSAIPENIAKFTRRACARLKGSLDDVYLPSAMAGTSLEALFQTVGDTEAEFWKAFLQMEPPEFLLAGWKLFQESKAGPESIQALSIVLKALCQIDSAEVLDRHAGPLSSEELSSPATGWTMEGDQVLQDSDLHVQEGEFQEALRILDSALSRWLALGAHYLADRPLRMRAMILRMQARVADAAHDLDVFEAFANGSGLIPLRKKALLSRALHFEDLGDGAQARKYRAQADSLICER